MVIYFIVNICTHFKIIPSVFVSFIFSWILFILSCYFWWFNTFYWWFNTFFRYFNRWSWCSRRDGIIWIWRLNAFSNCLWVLNQRYVFFECSFINYINKMFMKFFCLYIFSHIFYNLGAGRRFPVNFCFGYFVWFYERYFIWFYIRNYFP